MKEKIIEKRVPISQRPISIAVAGTAPGVGTTTSTLTLAGFIARRKYRTLYVEAGEPSIEDIIGLEISEQPVRWMPCLDVCRTKDMRSAVRERKYQYVLADFGAIEPEEFGEFDADLKLAILPQVHRFSRAVKWLNETRGVQFVASERKVCSAWGAAIGHILNSVDGHTEKVPEVKLLLTADFANFKDSRNDRAAEEILTNLLPIDPRKNYWIIDWLKGQK